MDTAASPSKLRPLMVFIVVISSAVGAIAGSSFVQAWRNKNSDIAIDSGLANAANEINRNLPMMVDQSTRLDATAALPGKKFLYRYTIINLEPTEEEIVSTMRPKAIENLKTAQGMSQFREWAVTLIYSYYDETGSELATFEVGPADIQ